MTEINDYSILFQYSPLPKLVYDSESLQIVDINIAAMDIYGYSRDEFLAMTIKQLRPNSEMPKLLTALSQWDNQTGRVHFGIFTHQKKNGELIRMDISGHQLKLNNRSCVLVVCQDVTEKENRLIELEESERKLKNAASIALLGYWKLEMDSQTLSWSDEVYKIWGVNRTNFELNYENFFDTIHPEDKDQFQKEQNTSFKGEQELNFVHRIRLPDGSVRWVHELGKLERDEEGNPIAFEGAVQDITKQKSTEIELIQNEKRFRALVENGSDAIAIIGLDGQASYVSPSIKNILGYNEKEAVNLNLFELVHPEDLDGVANQFQEAIDKPNSTIPGYTARIKHKNGNWRWLEATMTNMLHDPYINGIVDNFRDITERKLEEHRLKLLESVIINTNDAVLITEAEPQDEPGPKIIYVNEAFTKMTGYEADEVIGKTPRILQGPNSNAEELAKLGRALRNWEPYEITTVNYKKSGEEFWINFTVMPVADEKGWYTHWIAIERDVTEQKNKELENELIAQIRASFNIQNDYLKASNELCKGISHFGKFDLVELWTSNLEKSRIQLINHYVADPVDEKFYLLSSEIQAFQKSEDLIGKVWSKGVQLQCNDIEKTKDFSRRDAAKKIGLKSVLGIPLVSNNEILGVLVIGTKQEASHLNKYTRIFQCLEEFIGSELKRKMLENDLSHLFDAIPDILSVVDFQRKLLKINTAGCRLLGYSEEEILHQSFENFIHPEDIEVALKELSRIDTMETTLNFEVRSISKAGAVIWLSWFCNSNINEGLIYCTAKNITEEKYLRELNRHTRKIAKIGSWALDIVHQTLYWSEEVHQMHETDPNSFVPDLETAFNFYREDFRESVNQIIEKSIATGESFDFEAVLITVNKKELWVRAIGNTEFVDGTCTRIFGSFQDIHERKEVELRLKALADNLPCVVFQYHIYTDGTDNLLYVTKGSSEIWGFDADEVVQNNQLVWDQIHTGGDIEVVQKSISDSITTKSRWTAQWKYVMPNGEIKTHLGYGSPSFMADGSIVFNSVILDVTEEAKNEELLEQVSELAKVGSWEVDISKNKVRLSKMAYAILETDPLVFTPDFESSISIYRTDFRDMVKSKLADCIENGKSVNYEAVIVTMENNEKWVRVIADSEMYEGQCQRIFGSIQDISSQKEAEQERNNLQTALENSLNEIYIFDSETLIFSYINKGALLNLGYSQKEITSLTPLDLKPDFTESTFKQLISPLIDKEEKKIVFLTKHKRKDGSLYPVEVHLQLEGVDNNKRFLAIILDITERKKAEQNILLANERFQKATEATNDAIWDWDIVNETFYFSKAIERLFGEDSLKVITKESVWKDFIHVDDVSKVKNSLFEAIADSNCYRWELEYRIINIDKKTRFISDRGVIIRNDEGKAIRLVGAKTDITRRKQNEYQLLELNKVLKNYARELESTNEQLEQFAFIASHDLQEPLRMITSFLNQLERKYGDELDEKAHRYIFFATDGAKRMKQIILDLLKFYSAGKLENSQESLNLNDLINEYSILRKKIISEKSVIIKTNSLPSVKANKTPLTQTLHCILDNAIKYSKKDVPPVIEITVTEEKNDWLFTIRDNGIGIEPQFYEKIFIAFQRLHNREEYEGTGIGLSIAKKNVDTWGGKIWMDSNLNEGSTFYFTHKKH
ncbi:PAS domain S-box protein [Arenibacter algicola]|uniref:histidine kinase n=1 Tax=Arenibacter algicola TaxID=616991 RepID=A0A221V1D0_9FLAO|nr:PAS domain S-box protein [Arenibacter algicola]ASO07419.1 phytochrome-like protein cph1 [Arenibacter algicola]